MKKVYLSIVICLFIPLFACQSKPKMNMEKTEQPSIEVDKDTVEENEEQIEVDLVDREGISIGIATLFENKEGVHIHVEAHHLPVGPHGFHIHENGVCETPSFESAGSHFNPDGKNHGFDHLAGPHSGDLKNLEVKRDGTADQQFLNKFVTIEEGKKHSLLSKSGTSFIIHANPDDYISQPAGNAGERIACGVISKPNKPNI